MNKGNVVYLNVIFVLLIIYTLVLGYYAQYKPKFGTPPAIMLVLCVIFSVIYFYIHGETYADYEEFKFPPGIYWNFLVPMLIYNGGFHLKRENYLPNLGNSIIIAQLVTYLSFILMALLLNYGLSHIELTMHRSYSNELPDGPESDSVAIQLSPYYMLLFAALISCSDMGVCLGVGGMEKRTNLESTVGGECGINPIATIVLFRVIINHRNMNYTAVTPFYMIVQLWAQIVCVSIGFGYGVITCLLFKHFRSLTTSPALEVLAMSVFGCLSYFTANGTFVFGIMQNPGLC